MTSSNRGACLTTSFEVTHGGGTPAAVLSNTNIYTAIYNGNNSGGVTDGPATNHWGLGITHYINAYASTAAGANGSQHGGFFSTLVRGLPTGGYPSGRVGAQGWGGWIGAGDITGLQSSISGALTGLEMDLSAGMADDAGGRFGIQATIRAAHSTMCEWGRFLYVNGQNVPGNVTWFKSMLELFAPYTVAGIDMSQGTQSFSNPITGAPNAGVAIKLRAGQKYGLNGDGLTGQYLTYDSASAQTELWSAGRLIAAFPDGGGLIVPTMPSSPAGLPHGAFYMSGNAVMRVS